MSLAIYIPPVESQHDAIARDPLVNASPRLSDRYYSLDFWRGIACLAVVFSHSVAAGPVRIRPDELDVSVWRHIYLYCIERAYLGVPLFFVISGYCICASAESARRHGTTVGSYFYRRFRRIFPPYWICIAFTAMCVFIQELIMPSLIGHTMPIFPALSAKPIHWLGNLTLTEMWLGKITGEAFDWKNMFIGQSWTLGYEEQFYAVVGLVLFAARKYFYTCMIVVTAAVCVYVMAFNANYNSGYFFSGRWMMFAAGIGVYYDLHRAGRFERIAIRGLLLTGLAYSFRAANPLTIPDGIAVECLTASAFSLLLISLYRWDLKLHASRLLKPIAWCGTISYSIYLTHTIVCYAFGHYLIVSGMNTPGVAALVSVPINLLVCVALGWAFYRCVESRFMSPAKARIEVTTPTMLDIQPASRAA